MTLFAKFVVIGMMFMGGSMTSIAKPIPSTWVLSVMRRVQPHAPHAWYETYEETAEAIAEASNNDPLFAGEDGPMRTAALLLSIAFYESNFKPNAIGDHGHSYGLFQIQHTTVPELTANALLIPRDAAPIAIKLIRTSLKVCGNFGWHQRLGWYAAGSNGCQESGRKKSIPRMLLAEKILRENPDINTTIDDASAQ